MSRGTHALIDLAALRANLQRARLAARSSQLWAVLKADAYGHGVSRFAAALADADGFCVATLEEARALRRIDQQIPILLLEGLQDTESMRSAAALGLDIVVHHHVQLDLLRAAKLPRDLRVWCKIDTGMGRLGFLPNQVADAVQALRSISSVSDIVGMSHLASADDPDDPRTSEQLAIFRELCATNALTTRSLANSAGILGHPDSHFEIVRAGVMLYGVSPLLHHSSEELKLVPVMTLKSRLIAIKQHQAGDRIGYGGTFRCPEPMRIGTVEIGYGDGYPQYAPSGTPIMIAGKRCALAGRVSMDMLAVDLRGAPEAQVGSEVVAWGSELPAEVVAKYVGTIAYALICGVTPRVPYRYHGPS